MSLNEIFVASVVRLCCVVWFGRPLRCLFYVRSSDFGQASVQGASTEGKIILGLGRSGMSVESFKWIRLRLARF